MWRPSFSGDVLLRATGRVVVHGDRSHLVPHVPGPLASIDVAGVRLASSSGTHGLTDGDTCEVRGYLSDDGLALESVARLPAAQPRRGQPDPGVDHGAPMPLPASVGARWQVLVEERQVLTFVLSRTGGFRIIAFDPDAVRSALATDAVTDLPTPRVISSRWTIDEIDDARVQLAAVPHTYASGGGLGADDQFRHTRHVYERSPELDSVLRSIPEGLVEASVWFEAV